MLNLSPRHLLIAAALAILLVGVPMGHILMPLPWLVVVALAWWGEEQRGRGGGTVATYTLVTTLIVIIAFLAPVKTMPSVLARPLSLPKTELLVAEMDREANFEDAQWMPRYIHVAATPENANAPIRFRSTDITVGEFIETVESQSNLRHAFWHCGNGYTILFGNDDCFTLHLR